MLVRAHRRCAEGLTPSVIQGEHRFVAREETGDGVYEHGVGGSGVETAGFFERQDPLHPAIALGACRP